MKKTMRRITACIFVLILSLNFGVSALAYGDAYWDGYYESWDRGYSDGTADYNAGKDSAYAGQDTYETGKTDGYREGYVSGYEDAGWDWNQTDLDTNPGSGWILNSEIESVGGVPGQLNVMVDGACVAFPDVMPERVNGRIMVPMRNLLETLGAAIDFDLATRTVKASLNQQKLTHVIGSDKIAVTEADGTTREIQMDCSSYLRNGRTMVPVRFMSEALGCYVGWDATYQTAVVIDSAALCAEYDDQMHWMNLVLTDLLNRKDLEKTYEQNLALNLELHRFDTLNGDQNYSAAAKIDGLVSNAAMNLDVQIDITDFIDYLMENAGNDEYSSFGKLLKKINLELIYDQETGSLYLKSPILNLLGGQAGWYRTDAQEILQMPVLEFGQDLSMAELVFLMEQVNETDPFWLYLTVRNDLDALVQVLGDANFKTAGNTATLELNEKTLAEILDIELLNTDLDGAAFVFRLQVTQTGVRNCSWSVNGKLQQEDMRLVLDLNKRGNSADCTLTVHLRNELEITVKATDTWRVSNRTVLTQPSEGAVILDLNEI